MSAQNRQRNRKVFRTVRDARDKAVELILTSIAKGNRCKAGKLDKAARSVIEKPATENIFPSHRPQHRTSVHGNGANMTESKLTTCALDSWHLHFRRAALSSRVWHSQRSECLHRPKKKRASPARFRKSFCVAS